MTGSQNSFSGLNKTGHALVDIIETFAPSAFVLKISGQAL